PGQHVPSGRWSERRPVGAPRARPDGLPSLALGRGSPAAARVPVLDLHGGVPTPAGCGRTWHTSLRLLVASSLVGCSGRRQSCSWPVRWAPAGAGAAPSGRAVRLPPAPAGALAGHHFTAQEPLAAPESPTLH